MLRGKTGISAALAFAATLTVSGCTQINDGRPSPNAEPPSSPNTSSSSAKLGGSRSAPSIANPLDVSKFLDDPCLSITPAQAAQLTISPQGKRVNIQSGQACDWAYGPNLEWDIGVTYITPNANNGLQNLYDLNATVGYGDGYFEPTEISGYPAVYEDILETRHEGRCQIAVGVNPQVFFTVLNNGRKDSDPCRGAAKVAEAVVETIKGG